MSCQRKLEVELWLCGLCELLFSPVIGPVPRGYLVGGHKLAMDLLGTLYCSKCL